LMHRGNLLDFSVPDNFHQLFHYVNPNKMYMLQKLFYLTTALHVSGVTITHFQEHKTTVTTASSNRYTALELNFTDKEYR
jgi:hypothetical protein